MYLLQAAISNTAYYDVQLKSGGVKSCTEIPRCPMSSAPAMFRPKLRCIGARPPPKKTMSYLKKCTELKCSGQTILFFPGVHLKRLRAKKSLPQGIETCVFLTAITTYRGPRHVFFLFLNLLKIDFKRWYYIFHLYLEPKSLKANSIASASPVANTASAAMDDHEIMTLL